MSIIGTVLGSGTGIPSLRRNAPGYLLEAGGMRWLVDCGAGTLLQLERIQKGFATLDGVFITHTHADHIGDLLPLVHALRLPGFHRERAFRVFGPPGFTEFFNRIVAPVAVPPVAFPFHVEDMLPSVPLVGGEVLSHPTVHTERLPSVAYRFEFGGKSVVFSGDSDYDTGLIEFAQGADLLILDCSTLDENRIKGHLSAGLAGLVAARAGVARLIPTHFYPINGDDARRVEECRVHFDGPIDLAEDLMSFTV